MADHDAGYCWVMIYPSFWSTNAHFFLSPLTFLMYPTQPYSFQITNINFFVKRLSFSFLFISLQVLVQDLLHPTAASEARKHKLKTLVQGPRSYFLDVKCPGCLNITTVFSHAQTAVTCESCSTVLCTPTGGKAKLSEGTSFRRK